MRGNTSIYRIIIDMDKQVNMSIPSQNNSLLYKLYEECRVLLNTTDVGEQDTSMRRMAYLVAELEKKLMHQIPPELCQPMNGDHHDA